MPIQHNLTQLLANNTIINVQPTPITAREQQFSGDQETKSSLAKKTGSNQQIIELSPLMIV